MPKNTVSVMNQAIAACLGFLTICVVVYVLKIGKPILLPLVIAICLWYLINSLEELIKSINIKGYSLPAFICYIIALCIITGVVWAIVSIVVSNVSAVIKDVPFYQEKLQYLIDSTAERFHVNADTTLKTWIRKINYGSMLSGLAGAVQDMTKNVFLIIIYIIFLFMEQASFGRKRELFFASVAPERKLDQVISEGVTAMRKYLGVKTVASLVTALLSYAIMSAVKLDYAAFWALLIFLFNYIPSIGSIVATMIPAILTLVLFEHPLVPFIAVAGGITAVQFLIGNILEPRVLGTSLNISPLVVLLSLAFWGAIWGIPGMLFCVPIMSIVIMLFAQFDATRPIAILLSANGKVRVYDSDKKEE